MSTLAELFPAGAGKEVDFTASGAISAAGKPVILNSAGTVTQVAAPTVAEDIPLGDIWLYNSATNNRNMGSFPSHSCVPIIGEADTMVEAKMNGSSYPCVAIAKRDPSDNSITLGAQTVVSSNAIGGLSIAHDPTTGNERRGVVAYNYTVSSTKTAFANVYTITGSGSSTSDYSISIGSVAQLTNNMSGGGSILKMDPHTAGRFFYSYIGNYQADPWQQFQGQTMGLVTGTSIGSIASAFIETSGNMSIYFGSNIMDFDPNTANKLLICYGVYGLPFPTSHYDRMQGRVGILSSSTDYTPSWGTAVVFNSSSSNDTYKSMAWLHATADRAIAFYMDGAGGSKAGARMLTIGSGTSTSITVGSFTYFNDTYSRYHHILVDPDTDTILTCWDDASSQYKLHHRTATVNTSTGAFTLGTEHETMHSGTSISNSGSSGAICWDGALNGIFWQHGRPYAYNDDKNWLGMGRISKDISNLTSTNVIGLSKAAISDTASGTIVLKGGLATNLSSLTPGTDYYAQTDGTISTSSAGSAVKLGRALSSTILDLEYQS